jgi:hypothetical protein
LRALRAVRGAKIVDRFAKDLKTEFPDVKGFSPRNLKYMRRFAEAWPDAAFVQQLLHKLPWFHLCTLLDTVMDAGERDWYVRAVRWIYVRYLSLRSRPAVLMLTLRSRQCVLRRLLAFRYVTRGNRAHLTLRRNRLLAVQRHVLRVARTTRCLPAGQRGLQVPSRQNMQRHAVVQVVDMLAWKPDRRIATANPTLSRDKLRRIEHRGRALDEPARRGCTAIESRGREHAGRIEESLSATCTVTAGLQQRHLHAARWSLLCRTMLWWRGVHLGRLRGAMCVES